MLDWSIDLIGGVREISGLVVVLPPETSIGSRADGATPIVEVAGGKTRAASVAAGLAAVPAGATHVLVHDAARPFVATDLVGRLIDRLEGGANAVIPAARLVETIKRVSDAKVVETVDRSDLFGAQTPQAFEVDLLRRVHDAAPPGSDATDDAQLVEEAGVSVDVIEGDPLNFKITVERDFDLAEAIIAAGMVSLVAARR